MPRIVPPPTLSAEASKAGLQFGWLLPLAVSLLASGSAMIGTGSIIYVSPTGADNNPGTVSRPVLTPARAIELAKPGDTVYLRAGRYRVARFLWVDKPNLTISSYPGEQAAIVGDTAEGPGSPTSVVVIVADNVALVDLEIQGGSYYGVKVDVDRQRFTTGVQIRRCRIHHTGRDSIKSFNADKLLIEDCEIGPSGVRDPSNAEGIDSIGSLGVTIRRCYVHDTATNGIYLKGGTRDGVVERCRVENTGGHGGILLGQDTDLEYMRDGARHEAINCVARNNVVIRTGAAGVGTYSGKGVRFENNTLFDVAKKGQAGFWVVTNSRGVPSEQVTFKNNIVAVLSSRPLVFLFNLADQLDADANLYYSAGGEGEFRREVTAGAGVLNSWSFREWRQHLRVDARSLFADPLLDPAALYRPQPASPVIDRGVALVDVKDDFAGTARPQGHAYDIGAHEQGVTRGRVESSH